MNALLCLVSNSSVNNPLFRISTGLEEEGNGNPLQYSCLENPMDGGASWAAVHGVPKSRTQLSNFTFTFHFHALEKEMATHSSVLAWRMPGTGEPGGLPSMGLHRVRHDWSDLAAAAAAEHWFSCWKQSMTATVSCHPIAVFMMTFGRVTNLLPIQKMPW